MSERRIDGEHYYATFDNPEDEFDYTDGTFEIHRKTDGMEIVKWFHGDDGAEPDARSALVAFDLAANHFLAQGEEKARREAWAKIAELIYPAPDTDDWQTAYEYLTADLSSQFVDVRTAASDGGK